MVSLCDLPEWRHLRRARMIAEADCLLFLFSFRSVALIARKLKPGSACQTNTELQNQHVSGERKIWKEYSAISVGKPTEEALHEQEAVGIC